MAIASFAMGGLKLRPVSPRTRDTAVVSGRLREKHPDNSIYNTLCDIEWDVPAGEVRDCGGIAMMRADAFDGVQGFRVDLIAGEEPELCVRLRQQGWRIWRLDARHGASRLSHAALRTMVEARTARRACICRGRGTARGAARKTLCSGVSQRTVLGFGFTAGSDGAHLVFGSDRVTGPLPSTLFNSFAWHCAALAPTARTGCAPRSSSSGNFHSCSVRCSSLPVVRSAFDPA